ncbi:hypothetical protein MMC27_004243 [Xylographa pallens]|nr:hypothetical protein [Xylographa pallens]
MTEWENSIDLLARQASLPKLTLILDIDVVYHHPIAPSMKVHHLDVYKRLVQPLTRIRELRNLVIFLNLGAVSREFAGVLEKSIMGAEYDAVAEGKLQERRRRWHDGYSPEGPVFGPDGQQIWL